MSSQATNNEKPSRPAFYPWVKSEDESNTYSRSLSASEYVFALVNEYAQGHACPYMGATVSVNPKCGASNQSPHSLLSRVREGFVATRWKHPILATQVKTQNQLVYKAPDSLEVATWAQRVVTLSSHLGGWSGKFEELSREAVLPTADGDCVKLYLVLRPEQATCAHVTEFELILHAHHTLVDGAGLRSLLHELLRNLASPTNLTRKDYDWGEEAQRLDPAAIDVATISNEAIKSLLQVPKEVKLPALDPVEPGLGTDMVAHTFQDVKFLQKLKEVARSNQVKLTATLQAALAIVMYSELEHSEDDFASIISGFDLRKKHLMDPWGQRNGFVSAAVGLEMMRIPVSLIEVAHNDGEAGFWEVAKHLQKDWQAVAERADVAAMSELRRPASGLIAQRALVEARKTPKQSGLSFNYVSDPPGGEQLDRIYHSADSTYVLDKYQIVTAEGTPKLSCRSHSWEDHLTFAITFNKSYYLKETTQQILQTWTNLVETLV